MAKAPAPDRLLEPYPEWQEQALCGGYPEIDLWYAADPDPGETVDEMRVALAVAICNRCPVQADCLDYALRHGERFGIWGGTTPAERAEVE